jgi:hypothetical protein
MRMKMGTISAKKLNEALSRAKNVGLVEESFIIDGCDLTLRNLRPDEYAATLQDCQGLEDVSYLNAYQRGHIARSIIAINGVDFHETEFVEVEEDDPKKPGQIKLVKLELHNYLSRYILGTWSKESIYTAYRKFGDVLELAERKAKAGIDFVIPEETEAEKYRRLLIEAKEVESNIPDTLLDKILDDMGFLRKSTAADLKAAMEKTDQLAREQAEKEPEPAVEKEAEPAQEAAPPVQASVDSRLVMNQPVGAKPVDPHQTLQQAIAARQAGAQAPQTAPQPEPTAASRSAKIAALEADAGDLSLSGGVEPGMNREMEVIELKKLERIDPKIVGQIVDQAPVSGINPRFRPPPRV